MGILMNYFDKGGLYQPAGLILYSGGDALVQVVLQGVEQYNDLLPRS
jgi:hypothetical protein